jgi:hypothetical protein
MPTKDPQKRRELDRRKREANPEKYRELKRKWREANRERSRETNRRWREANPERCRENDRRKREANPDKYREFARQWVNANPERRLEIARRWANANQDKRRALCLGYRAKKKGVSPAGRRITSLALESRRALFGYRCAWCIDGLAEHDDHVVPMALGGLHVPENIVPACARCNSRKSASPPEQWYLSQPFFNRERWELICRHTNLQPSGAEQLSLDLDV